MHKSVLLKEFLEQYSKVNVEYFIDGTLGCGGHSLALLQEHPEIKELIGMDQDSIACLIAKDNLEGYPINIVQDNFANVDKIDIKEVDGIFLDIGVSSVQLNTSDRGFSFSKEGPLDMRMNNKKGITAADVVNTYSEEELGIIFRGYGEEPQWRRAARAIVAARKHTTIATTTDLANILNPVMSRKRKIHPLTLIFQALRIEVNQELEVLKQVLPKAIKLLRPGGILGVISFHSLEDRIVKNFFKEEAKKYISAPERPEGYIPKTPTLKIITKKPIIASPEEQKNNPRSRSAKMRFAEKLCEL
jgi:16S rRNA (cytosine1402-N4)-methyltransferase